jgi:hypothetical protein
VLSTNKVCRPATACRWCRTASTVT